MVKLAILLIAGALLAHQLYIHLSIFADSAQAIQYVFRGFETLILYAVVICLAVKAIRNWKILFLVVVTCIYGAVESFLIVGCSAIQIVRFGFGEPETTLTGQLCSVATGLPFFAIVQTALIFCFLLYLVVKPPVVEAEYSPMGNYIGYKRPNRTPWGIVAALFTYPYCGKVRIINGYLYKFSGGMIVKTSCFNPDHYVLTETEKPRPSGKWSIFNNCVTI